VNDDTCDVERRDRIEYSFQGAGTKGDQAPSIEEGNVIDDFDGQSRTPDSVDWQTIWPDLLEPYVVDSSGRVVWVEELHLEWMTFGWVRFRPILVGDQSFRVDGIDVGSVERWRLLDLCCLIGKVYRREWGPNS
jgi:hypothetical protein